MGLCYPAKYQEHYMRVFVKDERKFDAAMHAFNKTCKKFNEEFKAGGSDTKVSSNTVI